MNKERELLPWILGGLSAAAIAVAFAAVSMQRAAPVPSSAALTPAAPAAPLSPRADAQPIPSPASVPTAPAASVPTAPAASVSTASPAVAAQAASPAAEPASPAAEPPPLTGQAAVEPQRAAGQIWVCTTNGVKTFSNNPCGENSTLLEVGPINTMSAAPALHYVRAYGADPRYGAAYPDQNAQDDVYPDQYAAENGGDSYTIIQGGGFVARRRPEHFHPSRPSHNPQHNPQHNPGHNTAPVRRY